jgi:hypothetical protein
MSCNKFEKYLRLTYGGEPLLYLSSGGLSVDEFDLT